MSIEGDVVLPGLDIVAAAGGKNIALDRSFVVNVADGLLDISFASQRGDKATINAILVTGLPEGAPGTQVSWGPRSARAWTFAASEPAAPFGARRLSRASRRR